MRQTRFRFVLLSTSALAGVSFALAVQAQEVIDGSHETVVGDGSGTRPAIWTIGDDLILGNGSGSESVLEITASGQVSNTAAVVGQTSDGSVVVSGSGSHWLNAGTLEIGAGDGVVAGLLVVNGGTVDSDAALIGGAGSTADVTLMGSGTHWDIDGVLRVGDEGAATLLVRDGAEAEASALQIAADDGGSASVTISGSGLTSRGNGYIGGAGTNSLTVENGGRLSSGGMQITGTEGNAATVTVTGENSVWEAQSGSVVVGDFSDGRLNVLEGGRFDAVNVIVGRNGKGAGSVVLNGAGSALTTRSNLIVGHTGNGTVAVSDNGSLATGGLTVLGWNEDGQGTINLQGAGVRWTADGPVTLGREGEGRIVAGDGAQMSMHSIVLGSAARSFGSLELDGAETHLDVEGAVVAGQSGDGGIFLEGGARMSARSLVAGSAENAGAEIILYGGHLALEDTMEIGRNGHAGVVVVENGSLTAGGGISVGENSLLFIGGPQGHALLAPGILTTPSLAIGAGGELILNHSDNGYVLDTDLTGSGHLTVAAGSTTLRSGTGFAGTVGIDDGAVLTAASTILVGDIANEGTLVFDETANNTYRGLLSGTGDLIKSGAGHLTVDDLSGFEGTVSVQDGNLSYNGLFDGTVSVSGNGILSGAGTFNRLTIGDGGTFAPGNSIGTTRVSGGLGFGAGSVYEVEVNAAGDSDLIVVGSGTTIASSASVAVQAENGTDSGVTYAAETTYRILQSDDGITGTFGSVSENFAFLSAELSYDPTSVYLRLIIDGEASQGTAFVAKAKTPNQKATARGVASLGEGDLFNTVLVLPDGEAEAAFDALSGEAHASLRGQLLQDVRPSRDAVERRIRSAFDGVAAMGDSAFNGQVTQDIAGGWQIWGEAYGSWAERDGNGNAAGYERTGGGLVAGLDKAVTETWRLGAYGGFGATSFDVNARSSSGDTTSLTAGLYSGHRFGAFSLHGGSSMTWHGVDVTRNVRITGLNETLTSDYSAWTGQIFAEAAYTVDLPQARLSPFLGASLVVNHTDGFTETGGQAALKVSAEDDTTGASTLGLRAETAPLLLGESFLHFSGTIAWRHAIGDVTPQSTMRFDGGDPFVVGGAPLERNSALVAAAMTWSRGSALSLDLGYTGEIGETSQEHGARAGFSLQF